MKKWVILLCACLLATGALAQTQVDPAKINPARLDFSKARASIAGPDRIYIRSVFYGTEELSMLLQYDGKTEAKVIGVYPAKDKTIPDSLIAEFSMVRVVLPDSVRIEGVILSGRAYAGMLKWVPGTSNFALAGKLQAVPMPDTIDSLRAEISQMKQANERLGREAATAASLRVQLAQEKQAAEKKGGGSEEVAGLRAQLAKEQRSNVELNQEVVNLHAELATLRGAAVAVPVAAAPAPVEPQKPSRLVQSGIAGGSPLLGSWKLQADALSQQSPSARFAKYAQALPQTDVETLFELTAQAKAGGWVGYGLHFYASGEKTGEGYGFGNSLLVWLTSDQGYYKTDATYVQLYRSYDDFTMIQLASVGIPEAIGTELTTEVLYNPSARTIAVSVNGLQRLEYQLDDAILYGDKAALRCLGGPVDFYAFSMKVR
jgi:hypothetical protein